MAIFCNQFHFINLLFCIITFLPRDFHRLCIFSAQSRSFWSGIISRNFGLHAKKLPRSTLHNLKIQYNWSGVFKYWSSLVVPVGWRPWFKLCSRFLKVCTDKLSQFSRRDSCVWKFFGKTAKSWQNNICREKKTQKKRTNRSYHALDLLKDNLLTSTYQVLPSASCQQSIYHHQTV